MGSLIKIKNIYQLSSDKRWDAKILTLNKNQPITYEFCKEIHFYDRNYYDIFFSYSFDKKNNCDKYIIFMEIIINPEDLKISIGDKSMNKDYDVIFRRFSHDLKYSTKDLKIGLLENEEIQKYKNDFFITDYYTGLYRETIIYGKKLNKFI